MNVIVLSSFLKGLKITIHHYSELTSDIPTPLQSVLSVPVQYQKELQYESTPEDIPTGLLIKRWEQTQLTFTGHMNAKSRLKLLVKKRVHSYLDVQGCSQSYCCETILTGFVGLEYEEHRAQERSAGIRLTILIVQSWKMRTDCSLLANQGRGESQGLKFQELWTILCAKDSPIPTRTQTISDSGSISY